MLDEKDRYRPQRLEEIEDNGISIINEPVSRDGAITHPRWWSERALRPVLSEALHRKSDRSLGARRVRPEGRAEIALGDDYSRALSPDSRSSQSSPSCLRPRRAGISISIRAYCQQFGAMTL